jgi:hypothetical protein
MVESLIIKLVNLRAKKRLATNDYNYELAADIRAEEQGILKQIYEQLSPIENLITNNIKFTNLKGTDKLQQYMMEKYSIDMSESTDKEIIRALKLNELGI